MAKTAAAMPSKPRVLLTSSAVAPLLDPPEPVPELGLGLGTAPEFELGLRLEPEL